MLANCHGKGGVTGHRRMNIANWNGSGAIGAVSVFSGSPCGHKLSVGGEEFEAEARFPGDPAERDGALAALGRKYWMYSPVFALGKMLTASGLMRSTTGAFDVTLVA